MKRIPGRNKIALLASIGLLAALSIADIWVLREDLFEDFGNQFLNAGRMTEHAEAHRGVDASAQRRLDLEAAGIREVALGRAGGTIAVGRAEGSGIVLEYTVKATAGDAAAAEEKLAAVQVGHRVAEGRLSIVAEENGREIDRDDVAIDYALFVPDGVNVSIDGGDGTVRIANVRGDVDARTDGGLLDIVGAQGRVAVAVDDGEAYLSGIAGSIALENRNGDVYIEHANGPVTLNGHSGRTYMTGVTGQVTGEAELGAVQLRDIDGPVALHGRTVELLLDGIRGDMDVAAESSELRFILPEDAGYALRMAVTAGGIRSTLPLPLERDPEDDGNIRLNGVVGDGGWTVQVEATASEMTIHTKPPAGASAGQEDRT